MGAAVCIYASKLMRSSGEFIDGSSDFSHIDAGIFNFFALFEGFFYIPFFISSDLVGILPQ
jgi:hypothetical protein